jgi:hypothetical protein
MKGFLIDTVSAAGPGRVEQVYNAIRSEVIYPLIALGFGFALIYFLYNGWMYIRNVDGSDKKKYQNGLLYGILGLSIMSAAVGLVSIIQSTINSIAR